MASIVVKAASKLGGLDPVQTVVSASDAAAHIMDTVGVQQAKAKEAARNNDNEFNIRKKFLNNSVGAIREASYSQFNIVICTDQEHDDFQNLQGRILPMDLIDVEVSQGKIVNFQVYVFDTGKYLRHGKWERDHWCWWGETNKWHDPFAMHVHFENAQAKLDANQIKQQQDAQAAKNTTARTVATAVDKTLVQESHSNAQGLQIDAQSRAQDPSYIYGAEPGQTAAAGSHAPIAPMSFTTNPMRAAAGPAMQILSRGLIAKPAMRLRRTHAKARASKA